MADWKKKSIIQMITGAPGRGKTEMFYDEFGRLVDAQGIPVFNQQGLASTIDPENYSVESSKAPGFTSKQGRFVMNALNAPKKGGVEAGVKSPWETLVNEPETYNYGGPGIVKNRTLSPQEAMLLRKLFGE